MGVTLLLNHRLRSQNENTCGKVRSVPYRREMSVNPQIPSVLVLDDSLENGPESESTSRQGGNYRNTSAPGVEYAPTLGIT